MATKKYHYRYVISQLLITVNMSTPSDLHAFSLVDTKYPAMMIHDRYMMDDDSHGV